MQLKLELRRSSPGAMSVSITIPDLDQDVREGFCEVCAEPERWEARGESVEPARGITGHEGLSWERSCTSEDQKGEG